MANAGIADILPLSPLSPLQEGLLFHSLLAVGGADVYTVQVVMELRGPVDAGVLRAAAGGLLRHPNLRAGFRQGQSRVVQVIPAGVEVVWAELDLPGLGRIGAQ